MFYDIINYLGTIIAFLVVTSMFAALMLKFFKCETTLTNIYGGEKDSDLRTGNMCIHFLFCMLSIFTISNDFYDRPQTTFNSSTTVVLGLLGISAAIVAVALTFQFFSFIREHIKEK